MIKIRILSLKPRSTTPTCSPTRCSRSVKVSAEHIVVSKFILQLLGERGFVKVPSSGKSFDHWGPFFLSQCFVKQCASCGVPQGCDICRRAGWRRTGLSTCRFAGPVVPRLGFSCLGSSPCIPSNG